MIDWKTTYPEEKGIPSIFLLKMMERWERDLCHVHGYLILRGGQPAAEAYHFPYSEKDTRYVHSVSKSVTSLAIGFAQAEGLLSLDDLLVSFFPENEKWNGEKEGFRHLKLRHLLMMATGQSIDSIDSIFSQELPPWAAFFNEKAVDEPGSRFVYNSGATYMLSKILTMVTGETLLNYLKPRLFLPLGITDAGWDEIDGASTGGWGCFLSLRDMAKIGQLMLQKGKWDDRQLVPEAWILEMSSKKIDTKEANVYPDWQQGYGYQIWRCTREGCFRADGAFGQYILVLPPKDMVVAIWSEDAFSQDMLVSFWEEVYDKISDNVYGVDGNAYEHFCARCIAWATPEVTPPTSSYLEKRIDGKIFKTSVQEKESIAESIQFSFPEHGQLSVSIKRDHVVTKITAGNTLPYRGDGNLCFEAATFIRFGKKKEEKRKYVSTYQWLSDHVLNIHIDWLETAHTTEITCVFGTDHVAVSFSVSYRKFLLKLHSSAAVHIDDMWFVGKAYDRPYRRKF